MAQLNINKKNGAGNSPPLKLRIKIPRIDNTDLLARSEKVLMGRCLNPQIQNVDTFLFRMPQFWGLVGKVMGLNLGHGRFQFEFETVEHLKGVLTYGSTNFDGWMVSYVPWKAFADADYPSTISLWIRITRLPFEYRVEEVYKILAGSIGEIIQMDVEKSKVLINFPCSKPLIFSSILEFEEGNELEIMFDYKRLSGFCTLYHRMTHADNVCYKAKKEIQVSNPSNKVQKGLAVRNRSFKRAVLGCKSAPIGKTKSSSNRQEPASVICQSKVTEVVELMENKETSMSNCQEITMSSKKVRRPLFQEDIEPNLHTEGEKDIINTVPTLQEVDSLLLSVDAEVGGEDDLDIVDEENNMEETLDALALEAAVMQASDLPKAAMLTAHEDLAKRLQTCRETRLTKLPSGRSKVHSRPPTPLKGVKCKKMMVLAAMAPRLTVRENLQQGNGSKESSNDIMKP